MQRGGSSNASPAANLQAEVDELEGLVAATLRRSHGEAGGWVGGGGGGGTGAGVVGGVGVGARAPAEPRRACPRL